MKVDILSTAIWMLVEIILVIYSDHFYNIFINNEYTY